MYKWSLRITMSNLYKINGNLLALRGKLFKFPTVLINYFAESITIGTDTYYSMYCYYQGIGEEYTSREYIK